MNRKILTLIAPLFLFQLIAFSEGELKPDSTIESVSLFKDGAMITRTATLELPAGKSTIQFSSLPSTAQQDALQASLADSKVGVVRNATLFIPQDAEEPQNLLDLRDRIQNLKKSIESEEKNKTIAIQELNFAQKLSTSFSQKYGEISDGQSLSIEQAKETWEYTQSTISRSNQSIQQADERINDLNEQIKELSKELNNQIETYAKLRSVAEVEIEVAHATTTELSISYIVNNAYWQPRYELRANPSEKSLDFGYFAAINQFTGEDWNSVELSLHTNQVNRRGNVPELFTLVVDKYEPRHYKPMKSRAVGNFLDAPAPVAESLSFASTNRVVDEGIERDVSISSSTVSFQITPPGKPSIPSARKSKTLSVSNQSFETKYWSEVVPGAQLDAYLIGETTNQLEIPILPGQALAFVDGKLSSKVFLDKTLPQEELKLSLGTDANIVVKRHEGTFDSASTGFIDKTTTIKREYVNEVSSFHSIPHDVVVIDQFPISRNAKIEIDRIAPDEASIELDQEREGVFQWETSIPAKGKRSFTTSFEIVYPRDWEINPDL